MQVVGLTHLVVNDAGPDLSVLSQTLPLFRNLETFALGTTMDHEFLIFPTLHLEELPELRSVNLDRLMPGSIRLSKDSWLYVTITGRLTASKLAYFETTPNFVSELMRVHCKLKCTPLSPCSTLVAVTSFVLPQQMQQC